MAQPMATARPVTVTHGPGWQAFRRPSIDAPTAGRRAPVSLPGPMATVCPHHETAGLSSPRRLPAGPLTCRNASGGRSGPCYS